VLSKRSSLKIKKCSQSKGCFSIITKAKAKTATLKKINSQNRTNNPVLKGLSNKYISLNDSVDNSEVDSEVLHINKHKTKSLLKTNSKLWKTPQTLSKTIWKLKTKENANPTPGILGRNINGKLSEAKSLDLWNLEISPEKSPFNHNKVNFLRTSSKLKSKTTNIKQSKSKLERAGTLRSPEKPSGDLCSHSDSEMKEWELSSSQSFSITKSKSVAASELAHQFGISKINSSKKAKPHPKLSNKYCSSMVEHRSLHLKCPKSKVNSSSCSDSHFKNYIVNFKTAKGQQKRNHAAKLLDWLWVGITKAQNKLFWKMMTEYEQVDEALFLQLEDANSEFKPEIINDIDRTPLPSSHDSLETKQKLIRILERFACHNSKVGYVQGMNYLAAALYIHFDDEIIAFRVLIQLMHKFNLQELYHSGFDKLKHIFEIIERSVEWEYPAIQEKFDQLGIFSELYSTQWIMTLFTSDLIFKVDNSSPSKVITWDKDNETIPFDLDYEYFKDNLVFPIEYFMLIQWDMFNVIPLKILKSVWNQIEYDEPESVLKIIKKYYNGLNYEQLRDVLSVTGVEYKKLHQEASTSSSKHSLELSGRQVCNHSNKHVKHSHMSTESIYDTPVHKHSQNVIFKHPNEIK